MDIIDFVLGEKEDVPECAYKVVEVFIVLNGTQLPDNIFNAPEVVAASFFKNADFDLCTCSCGTPGCAGYHEQVVQEMDDKTVKWTFPSEGYKNSKEIFEFDKEQFQDAFASLYQKLMTLETQDVYYLTLLDSYDNSLRDDIQNTVNWYKNRYQAQENFDNCLREFSPELFSKSFYFSYEGEKSKYPVSFRSLVGRLMNQYPQDIHEPFFLAKSKLAAKAVEEFLTGNNALFKKMATHSYSRYGLKASSIIAWDFDHEINDMNFNDLKICLIS